MDVCKYDGSFKETEGISTIYHATKLFIDFMNSKKIDYKGFKIVNCFDLSKEYDLDLLYKLFYNCEYAKINEVDASKKLSREELAFKYGRLDKITFRFSGY